MHPFAYSAVSDADAAIARAATDPEVEYIAGGTDLLQLLKDCVRRPTALLDLTPLPLRGVSNALDGIHIGALTTLADAADDPTLKRGHTAVAQALRETASPQIRNMATVGGNLLQRTRCLYFRDPATPCNKRDPGSGCPALDGENRINAILGGSPHCIAVHPSDLAVALVASEADVVVTGTMGERSIRVEDLYRVPGDTPYIETVLQPGEIITMVRLPPDGTERRSLYLKVRDRASFEWAIASCAAALTMDGDTVDKARIAVGGVATKPWRLHRVEEQLTGEKLEPETIRRAASQAAEEAEPRGGNAYKVTLLERTVERALATLGGLA